MKLCICCYVVERFRIRARLVLEKEAGHSCVLGIGRRRSLVHFVRKKEGEQARKQNAAVGNSGSASEHLTGKKGKGVHDESYTAKPGSISLYS